MKTRITIWLLLFTVITPTISYAQDEMVGMALNNIVVHVLTLQNITDELRSINKNPKNFKEAVAILNIIYSAELLQDICSYESELILINAYIDKKHRHDFYKLTKARVEMRKEVINIYKENIIKLSSHISIFKVQEIVHQLIQIIDSMEIGLDAVSEAAKPE